MPDLPGMLVRNTTANEKGNLNMTTNHTPGPWTYSPKTLLITGSDGYRLSDPIRHDDTRLANTRLAAAAPDLLAALVKLLEGGHAYARDAAEAAIAKATGGAA